MTRKIEIAYGRTWLGQLIHDLGFTTLGDGYLARKHHLPVKAIRCYRATVKRGLREGARERARLKG